MGKLTAVKVRNEKRPGRYADGGGLYLLVRPEGSKSWVLRVVVNGRRRDYGLGGVDLVPLAEARERALEGRRLAKAGANPALHWKQGRDEVPTFQQAAERYHETIKSGWKNEKHSAQWLATLKAHVFPSIGSKRVDLVDVASVQAVLLPIWLTIPETARRVRQRVGAVLDFAHSQGWRETELSMRGVSKGLPRQGKDKGNFEAMPYDELPAFMKKIEDAGDTVGRLALRFTILTAARSGETRGMPWDELDLPNKVWNVPAHRMKGGLPHSVPLSGPAIDILEKMAAFKTGAKGELVFKGKAGGALSDMTLTKALRTAGVAAYTVHGMRSSFRDWVAEKTSFPGEWAEAALAHVLKNKVEAAYLRTKYLDQRVGLMDAWAGYLTGDESKVVKLVAA